MGVEHEHPHVRLRVDLHVRVHVQVRVCMRVRGCAVLVCEWWCVYVSLVVCVCVGVCCGL